MTLTELIAAYRTDPDSPIRKLRYATKQNYANLTARLDLQHGYERIDELKARDMLRWHEMWSADGKIPMGHSLIGMLRTLCSFGATIMDDESCLRLSTLLSKQRFAMGKPRTERLTSGQANAVRAMAHKMGFHSVALAQAFQFECILRQRDSIGEWVPVDEPGVSAVLWHGEKWLRGITWNEIDEALILRHITSKRNKLIEVPLQGAPMLIEEFTRFELLPERGPIIISEATERPYTAVAFRRLWREIATAAGIPNTVRNMDSRAGAITEATEAGADLEHIKHAATHSDIAMTQRYARGAAEKTAGVMEKRAAFRLAGNREIRGRDDDLRFIDLALQRQREKIFVTLTWRHRWPAIGCKENEMDSYQPIYDAVRSRISSCDIGSIVESAARGAFDTGMLWPILQQEFCIAAGEMARPSAVYRPSVVPDGNKWCALYGDDLMHGVSGFGDTPEEAMRDFDQNWLKQKTPTAIRMTREAANSAVHA